MEVWLPSNGSFCGGKFASTNQPISVRSWMIPSMIRKGASLLRGGRVDVGIWKSRRMCSRGPRFFCRGRCQSAVFWQSIYIRTSQILQVRPGEKYPNLRSGNLYDHPPEVQIGKLSSNHHFSGAMCNRFLP